MIQGFAKDTFCGLANQEVVLMQHSVRGLHGIGVEIGCCDGFSTAIILESSKLKLHSFDPMIPDSMEKSLKGDCIRLMENTERFGIRFHFWNDRAENLVNLWHEPLDFLFIDGDHTPEAVRRDFNQWTPFLKKGGLLAMHDCRMGREGSPSFHPGPSQVAGEEIFSHPDLWQIIGEAFTLCVARKLF